MRDNKRSAGILAHITSLAGPFGIGDLGPSARDFATFLHRAGQKWWQVLPLCPPGAGNCPYSSPSTLSRNPMMISPQDLIADGLLDPSEIQHPPPFPTHRIDFVETAAWKTPLLLLAANRLPERRSDLLHEMEEFLAARPFIHDAALFHVYAQRNRNYDCADWPEPYRSQRTEDLPQPEDQAAVRRYERIQFLVYRQLQALKSFCLTMGIRFIGDVPIYVNGHSADVWANRALFSLDASGRPTRVAGVPPDYFNDEGQLWGNPLYDWPQHAASRYKWWITRLQNEMDFAAAVRLDHFRALAAYYTVAAGSPNAKVGKWEPGPADDFLTTVLAAVGSDCVIAEDLGLIDNAVHALRDRHALPGMAVLQFAYGGTTFDTTNPHLPENHVPHSVVYTGTHDNDTSQGWWKSLPEHVQRQVLDHLKPASDDTKMHRVLVQASYQSCGKLVITPVQDWLGHGTESRMNIPGYAEGNWGWRMEKEGLTDELTDEMLALTKAAGRL